MSQTIAAIATAYGVGAISIVRISGDKAIAIASKLTKRSTFNNRYAHLCDLFSQDDSIIDQAIVITFKAPHSFTTEDVVEIQSHGGSVISSMILKEVLLLGARIAEAGEFSKRAYLGGRIDLSEAEAISALIEAKSEDAVKILATQMKGSLKEFVYEIRDQFLEMLAYVEVNIDYAEEDLPQDILVSISKKLDDVKAKLEQCKKDSESREQIMGGFKVAIIGKPNVGKSSLLNTLLNYERAIISDIAGTTRDSIEESIKIGSHIIKIIDTAGIRDSDEVIEKIGIQRSIIWAKEADIIISLFDGSKEFDVDDQQIVDIVRKSDKDKIVIINKSDLNQKIDRSKLIEFDTIDYSCKSKNSILYDKLKDILDRSSTYSNQILTSTRQVTEVSNALDFIESSKIALEDGELEIFALEINRAILSISSISKSYDNDEMLDKMFGNFCLGK
jgi:tRNA modification GTPase